MSSDGRFTRQVLKDYRHLQRELRAQQMLLAEMEEAAAAPPPLPSGDHGGTSDGRPMERSVIRIETQRVQTKQMEIFVSWRKRVVNIYLSQVTDPVVKTVMYQRYVAGRSWKQIAVRHGGGCSESALRMLVVRYTDRNPITWIIH